MKLNQMLSPPVRSVIYGVTDRSKDPLWQQLNDFFIDHAWITNKEKSLFFNSLKLLVLSGIRLPRALKILAERTKNPRLKRILDTISYDMNQQGASLSSAMSKYPQVFRNSEIKMILSGEISGKLEQVLGYITTQIQKNLKLHTQLRSALVYPITVFIGIFLATIVILVFVVPQFESLFASFGSELPASTKFLINTSRFVQSYWWFLIFAIMGGLVLFQNWKKSPNGRQHWDQFLLDTPLVNRFLQNFHTVQICSNFSTLLSSGVSVVKSLQVLRQIIDNTIIQENIYAIERAVRAGKMFHESFAEAHALDPVIAEVIEIGEQSGAIAEILERTGQQYELEFDADMENFAKIIEPIVLVIVAGAIIFMGSAILTPILQLQELFTAQ